MNAVQFVSDLVRSVFYFFQSTEIFGLSLGTWALGFVFLGMVVAMIRGSR